MNKKIIAILIIIMMSFVIVPAYSTPIKIIEPIIKTTPQQQLKFMTMCIVNISGTGQIWKLPGILVWRIDTGNINITYLGGSYDSTSGRGMFMINFIHYTNNPIQMAGVGFIGILF